MKSKIVLAPPYSGVLFWLLSNHALNRPVRSKFDENHPYYDMYGGYFRNILGENPSALLDEILSISLLYDELYLPPSDINLPNYSGSPGRYYSKELGVTMDWNWRLDISEKLDQSKTTDFLLSSPIISSLVNKHPDKSELVWNSVVLLHMSEKLDATIVASQSTIRLLKEIKRILSEPISNAKEKTFDKEKQLIGEIFKISGLCISIENLDEYIALKSDSAIIEYGSNFRMLIQSLPNDKDMEVKFYQALMSAIEKHELSSNISAGLNVSATTLGAVSLIPLVGTITGAAGLATDLGSRRAEQIANKNSFWSLAPTISKTLTKHRIEQRINKLNNTKG